MERDEITKDFLKPKTDNKSPGDEMKWYQWVRYRFSKKYPPYLHRLLMSPSERMNKYQVPRVATVRLVRNQDYFMRNALHIACANNASVSIIELLINIYPEAMNQRDKSGRLPFHTACAHHRNLYALEYMIDCTENLVLEKTAFGVSENHEGRRGRHLRTGGNLFYLVVPFISS